MTAKIDFWFDFSCPYAYLASTQIEGLAARTGAELVPCPLLLGGVFRALNVSQRLFDDLSPAKQRHGALDLQRWASLWGVTLRMPSRHPFRTVNALRTVLACPKDPWPLIHAYFRAYWVEGMDLGDDAVLLRVMTEAGYDANLLLAEATTAPRKAELRARTDEALGLGIFGVPAFVIDGQLVWGQDRLDRVERLAGGTPAPRVPADTHGVEVDLWFDYSSPFSALGVHAAAASLGLKPRLRPMLLGGVFRAIGGPNVPLFTMNAKKAAWMRADMLAQATEVGFDLKWPGRFPMRTVLPLRMTLAADPSTLAGERFVHRVYKAYWTEDQDIADPAVLALLANEVGLDGPALIEAATSQEIKDALIRNGEEAVQLGVFGAPTTVLSEGGSKGRLFWGADRLHLASLAAQGGLGGL